MRQCGDCQLCCKLLAVRSIGKRGGEKCKHQKFHKGCTIYNKPEMPQECVVWNCRWLVNDDMDDQSRPDRSHIVVDIMPDFITAVDNETGAQQQLPVIQVWVDPNYPDAHRDPAFRAYLDRVCGREGMLVLIRYNESDAFTIWPPSVAPDGQWHEMNGENEKRSHSAAEIIDTLARLT